MKTQKSFSGCESPVIDDSKISAILGFNVLDSTAIEKAMFTSINSDDREKLLQILQMVPSSTTVLQILLTTTYPNRDNFYQHDPEDLLDAEELLGSSLEHLNAIQIACILGEEDIALDILEFVTDVTEEIEARKVLYEFMGRIWGDGNTTLHLASFMGMCELVRKMIELGAATGKGNNRKYKPVDCAGDDETRNVFETVTEVDRNKRKASLSTTSIIDLINNTKEGSKEGSISSLEASVVVPQDPYSVVKGHSKSASADAVRKTRSGSGSKTRTSRSGTLSQFQASQLTHSRDSSSASKPKKSVRFDPGTSLIYLCQHGDGTEESLQKVRDCLDAITAMGDSDVDINNVYTPHQWLTPLHVACSHGKTEIAKILLESGAAVNIEDKESWTPLHCAAAEGHVEIIKLLGKCQGNLQDEDKSNPDWIYVLDGPINLEPLNDDNELPEDVALEAKLDDIQKAIADLKTKYPPPLRTDEKELTEDKVELEEVEDEVEAEPIAIDDFSKNLRRAASVMKHSRDHHRRESDDIQPSEAVAIMAKMQLPEPIPIQSSPAAQVTFPTDVHSELKQVDTPTQIQPDVEPVIDTLGSELPQVIPLKEDVVVTSMKTEPNEITATDTQQEPKLDTTFLISKSTDSLKCSTFSLQSAQSIDQLKDSTASLDLLSPSNQNLEPFPPSGPQGEPRKARRNNSISRKKPADFEVERASHAGEQMKPPELQRRISKSQKDAPVKTDVVQESIPSVAALKRSFTLKSTTEAAVNREKVEMTNTQIQDRIKMFSGGGSSTGEEPKMMKSPKKGKVAL